MTKKERKKEKSRHLPEMTTLSLAGAVGFEPTTYGFGDNVI